MRVTADVQLENGYTRIANEIIENVVKLPLNGTQFRIIMLLWRETYGFSRKECSFSETYIASRLKICRQQIQRKIKLLFESKIIQIIQEATFSSSRIISFNKNFDEWQLISMQETKTNAGSGLDASSGNYVDASTGSGLVAHRKKPINKPLKKPPDERFSQFWQSYPKKKSKGDAEKAWKALKPDNELLGKILKSIETEKLSKDWQKDGGQYIPYPSTWLRAEGWEDEPDGVQESSRFSNYVT